MVSSERDIGLGIIGFVLFYEVRGSNIPPGCAVWSVLSQEVQLLVPLIIPLFRNLARTCVFILGLISGVSANPC